MYIGTQFGCRNDTDIEVLAQLGHKTLMMDENDTRLGAVETRAEGDRFAQFVESHAGAYDGIIEENMTLCIESFTGSTHGGPGVKLEQMVRVTADGCEVLSTFPFEDELLA